MKRNIKLFEMTRRLELRGNKYYLGEFLEFKGKQDDTQALRHIRRSKVSRVVVQKTSMLGFGKYLLLFSAYFSIVSCFLLFVFYKGIRN